TTGEVAQRLPRERDRHRADGHVARADRGLASDPFSGCERLAKEPVHDGARGPLHECQLVGPLHLALYLGLTDDHRVEPGSHAEEMACSLAVPDRVEMRDELGRPDVSLTGKYPERGGLCLDIVPDGEIELGSVAGGERDRLVDVLGRDELSQDRCRSTLR